MPLKLEICIGDHGAQLLQHFPRGDAPDRRVFHLFLICGTPKGSALTRTQLQLRPQQADNVISRDYANKFPLLIHHRKRS